PDPANSCSDVEVLHFAGLDHRKNSGTTPSLFCVLIYDTNKLEYAALKGTIQIISYYLEGRMTSLKRWRQIGQGQFHKWETPGDEFEWIWRGMHDGRFGPLGTLEIPKGLVTFPLHAALLERLKLVREGAEVLIRYTGKQTSKAGRVFKAFEVFVTSEAALVESQEFASEKD